MRQKVRTLIDDTLASLQAAGTLSYVHAPSYAVEVPKNPEHGDWSCNVAMTLTKATGKKPEEIARLIVEGLVDRQKIVVSVEVARPGFLNFRLTDRVFQQVAREVLLAGATWGRQAPHSTGKKVLVEFVSTNPTGPVHIGHARGAFMGDALARLLDAAGHEVTREYYINDYGNQVDTLGRTVWKRYQQLFGVTVELGAGEYPGDYVIDIAKTWKAEVGDRFLNAPESEWLPAATAVGVRENMRAIRATLAKANVRHDAFFSEASLHESGKVKAIADLYRARGVTYEATEGRRKDHGDKVRTAESNAAKFTDRQLGGTFLMTSTFTDEQGKQPLKDDEDRILLRHDGSPVYLTADLAYHKDKFDRGFDLIVDVFGADHAGHLPRIESGMTLLGYDMKKLVFVLVQMMRITRGGQVVKLSKRKGEVEELADLIDAAGADVCRFLFLMKTANSQFDFDLDLVTKQSRENPVFYLQYGHARCASILARAADKGVAFVGVDNVTDAQLAQLTMPEEKAMLKKLSQLPDVVATAADRLEPHHVLYFCQELIGDFHSYYSKDKSERVISDDVDKTQGRLALVAALKHTLHSAFGLLGITAPEHMQAPADDDAIETAIA